MYNTLHDMYNNFAIIVVFHLHMYIGHCFFTCDCCYMSKKFRKGGEHWSVHSEYVFVCRDAEVNELFDVSTTYSIVNL